MDGSTDVEHIFKIFDFNCAVDAEIRPRALGKSLVDGYVHGDGTVLHRRIDARDMAGNYSVARVDGGFLPDGGVLGLSFRDLNFGFELLGSATRARLVPGVTC